MVTCSDSICKSQSINTPKYFLMHSTLSSLYAEYSWHLLKATQFVPFLLVVFFFVVVVVNPE